MSGSNGILVTPSDPPTQRDILQIVGRDLGQDDWGSAIHHVSFDSDTEFSHTIKNLGTGGSLQLLTSSGGNAGFFDDTGLVVSAFLATGDVGFFGNTTIGNASSDTLTVNATSAFNAAVTINASLHVTGAGLFDGTLGAGATTLSSLHVTGAALVDGTLGGGATTLSSLHVTGAALVDGTFGAGATTVTTLHATGNVTADAEVIMTASASKIVPGATSLALRNNADSTNNVLVTDAGAVTTRNALTVTTGGATISAGALTLGDAASQIVPGGTSVSLRNHANSADNLIVTDAGAATVRAGLTVTAGNLAVSSGTITASSTVQGTRLISTVAIGTAPLGVTSTTVVPNLNVSFLNGHPDSDFALVAGGYLDTSGTGQTKSGALTVQGTFSTEGNTAIGNASGDTLTVTATSTFTGGVTFTTLTSTGNAAASGTIRLANGLAIKGRNALNTLDINIIDTNVGDGMSIGDGTTTTAMGINANTSVEMLISGTTKFKVNGTGVGFFASAPNARQNIVGVRTGTLAQLQTVVGNLLSGLANYGLITDSTT